MDMTVDAPTANASASRWARLAAWLVAGTTAYNVIEAVLAIWSGVRADSVALVGFGLDSVIECAAAGVVLWRLAPQAKAEGHKPVAAIEDRVRRFVGMTFVALAIYVVAQAGWALWNKEAPEESTLGIVLAVASLVIMPLVAWGKLVAARHIGSRALRAEAKETLACSYLSFALLLGLATNAALGWWWADPVAGLVMVPWLVKEGVEGLREDECGEHGTTADEPGAGGL